MQTVKVPLRWTAITASHSSSVMLNTMRSRRIPGGRDYDVELAVVVERGLDDVLAALHSGDGVIVGDGLAARGLYLVNNLVGGRSGHAGAVQPRRQGR